MRRAEKTACARQACGNRRRTGVRGVMIKKRLRESEFEVRAGAGAGKSGSENGISEAESIIDGEK